MQVQTDPFNFSSSRSAEKFSIKVCSEKFTQGPVDPDPVFNRDRFCVQKILGKIRLKKFRTNPVIFVILNADPHSVPTRPPHYGENQRPVLVRTTPRSPELERSTRSHQNRNQSKKKLSDTHRSLVNPQDARNHLP